MVGLLIRLLGRHKPRRERLQVSGRAHHLLAPGVQQVLHVLRRRADVSVAVQEQPALRPRLQRLQLAGADLLRQPDSSRRR